MNIEHGMMNNKVLRTASNLGSMHAGIVDESGGKKESSRSRSSWPFASVRDLFFRRLLGHRTLSFEVPCFVFSVHSSSFGLTDDSFII
ncbi:MAG: hypothetical protein A2X67_02400 [Ignavibacteria bacterium GWA2_55_11]|nr:MAG: hypothetical protein A2X67_02400 [Ignavibacteria bacterium GWA2_55_11]OGU73956.1 MAG: hypothetical protein A3H45_14980 [Ignavibacteria bacterium RIFCSPLOWO2_02_FULL_55_14]